MISRKYKQKNNLNFNYFASHTMVNTKNMVCQFCKHRYFIGRDLKSNINPLLLPCGHVICSACENTDPSRPCLLCPDQYVNKQKRAKLPYNIYVTGLMYTVNSTPVHVEDIDISFHSQQKALQNDKSESLNKNKFVSELNNLCPNHLTEVSDYFCKDCDTEYCAHCIIKFHKNHNVIQLTVRNEELMPEFQAAYTKFQETIMKTYQARKKIATSLRL